MSLILVVEASYQHVYRDRTEERLQIIEALTHFELGKSDPKEIILSTYKKKPTPVVQELEEIFENDSPIFKVIETTGIDGVDFAEGFLSGVFDKDVRGEWKECIVNGPESVLEIVNLVKDNTKEGLSLLAIIQDA